MQHADILALAGLRVDGRRPNEVRTIKHKLGVTPTADGSVYYEQGLNKILVNVHGPQEPDRRADDADKGSIAVSLVNAPFSGSEWKKRRSGDKRTAELETTIKDTFEGVVLLDLYPRSEIRLVVHMLESNGSTVCAILNACSLALMHAGINMSDMVVACSVGHVKGEMCVDCSQVEQTSGGAFLPVAVKAHSEDILLLSLDARLSVDKLEEAIAAALRGCRTVKTSLENAIKDHMAEAQRAGTFGADGR